MFMACNSVQRLRSSFLIARLVLTMLALARTRWVALYCSTMYLGAITPVPCIGTCGSRLAYIIFPAVALLVGAVLLNLVTAILINGFRCLF